MKTQLDEIQKEQVEHSKMDDARFTALREDTAEIKGRVRVIEQSTTDMHDTLKEIRTDGKETKANTQKTNGRVTALEAWQKGIIMCLALISFAIIPLAIYAYNLGQENLKNEILNEIKK